MPIKRHTYLFSLALAAIIALWLVHPSLFAQKARPIKASKPIAVCSLERSAGPKVRGLYVGMPVEEFLKIYPSSKPDQLGNPEVGEVSYDIDEQEQPTGDNVRIVTIKFLDGKLSFVSFTYWDFEPPNDEDFVRQAAEKFHLPANGWKTEPDSGFRAITCRGFRVNVCKCDGPREPGPSLILDDPEAEHIVQERLNAKKRKEIEQKRRKEQERRIFKPFTST